MFQQRAQQRSRARSRELWIRLHGYLGLLLGALFSLQGITGSLSVFRLELAGLFDSSRQPVFVPPTSGAETALDTIVAELHRHYPILAGTWTLALPQRAGERVLATYTDFERKPGDLYSALEVDLHPVTGDILDQKYFGDDFASWVLDLHWAWLSGRTGFQLVGLLAIVLLVSVVTGVYLWWPVAGRFRQALRMQRSQSRLRRLFDLHRISGIYLCAVLSLMALTAAFLVFWPQIESAHAYVTGARLNFAGDAERLRSSCTGEESSVVGARDAVAMAREVFPGSSVRLIEVPGDLSQPYIVRLLDPSQVFTTFYSFGRVSIDPCSGKVLSVHSPQDMSFTEFLIPISWSIHSGHALALPGRILLFLVGFTPLLLFLTGLCLWRERRRTNRACAAK